MPYVLALDQGTTSSRAMVFDDSGAVISCAQQEFPQLLPQPGEVEHDPEDIWQSQLATAREALRLSRLGAEQIAAIGIANQRETTVLWDRATGQPLANAIVWQSRVSADICRRLIADGVQDRVRDRTGLFIDPYFSATKLKYLLDRNPAWRHRAEQGELAFGTIDAFLIWRLTGGKAHVTDASNASRTLLMNLSTLDWDDELLELFQIPRALLPRIVDSSGVIAECDAQWFGAPLPIAGCAGDQQAATFGQRCFREGEAKCTYGTGCFALMNIGSTAVPSQHRLLTTVGWRIGSQTVYCLEGSVFVAGAVVQWLRDQLGWIETSQEVEALARQVSDSGGVVLVPAFTGLGAPHWDPEARGAIFGLTRGSNRSHIARAAIESIAFQTQDLLEAMRLDYPAQGHVLRVDGGAANNDLLMQIQADWSETEVRRPEIWETTALGAAFLAGLGVGIWPDRESLCGLSNEGTSFYPEVDPERRHKAFALWRKAVERSMNWNSRLDD